MHRIRPITADAVSLKNNPLFSESVPQTAELHARCALPRMTLAHVDCAQDEESDVECFVAQLKKVAQETVSVALICESSLDGILGAVGVSYLAGINPSRLRLIRSKNPIQLGEVALSCPSFEQLSLRVFTGVEKSLAQSCPRAHDRTCSSCSRSLPCINRLIYASASDEEDVPELCHRYIRLCFTLGSEIRNQSCRPEVLALDALWKSVSNECEKMRQFTRFSRGNDGSFSALIHPKANVIPFIMPYFVGRLKNERFFILDSKHHVVGVYEGKGRPAVFSLDDALTAELRELAHAHAQEETYVQALWKSFYDSTALPGRDKTQRGYDLRTHLMPKRFWDMLSELDSAARPFEGIPKRYQSTSQRQIT